MKHDCHYRQNAHGQRGISLVIVLVLLLLSLTAVLGAFRVANLNEAMLGSSSDFSRTQEAAEALVRDAELDIRTSSARFARSTDGFDAITDATVAVNPTQRCANGVCMPVDTNALARIENNLAVMTQFGAAYGAYTLPVGTVLGASTNPILNSGNAWYWVEGFVYSKAVSSGVNVAADSVPDTLRPFVYRITAVAQGRKAGTQVVIKTIYVPYPASQNK